MDRKRTYIREWREKKGFTLDQMVGRLAAIGVDTTGASLSRIERAVQPYSQDILEAIAVTLDVEVGQLLEDNPTIDSSVLYFVRDLDPDQAKQAEAVLRAMFDKTA